MRRKTLASLTLIAAGSPVAALANPITASALRYEKGESISLTNLHTKESLVIEMGVPGDVPGPTLTQFDHFMRDHYSGEVTKMDPSLIMHMFELQREMQIQHGSIEIISGYRSPRTNEMLRKRGRRVARNSMHLSGRAIDFRVAGVELKSLRDAALDLKAGGVGFYSTSGFLHFDTGRVRHW